MGDFLWPPPTLWAIRWTPKQSPSIQIPDSLEIPTQKCLGSRTFLGWYYMGGWIRQRGALSRKGMLFGLWLSLSPHPNEVTPKKSLHSPLKDQKGPPTEGCSEKAFIFLGPCLFSCVWDVSGVRCSRREEVRELPKRKARAKWQRDLFIQRRQISTPIHTDTPHITISIITSRGRTILIRTIITIRH